MKRKGKTKLSKGQWQVERERSQITSWRQENPMREPDHVSQVIPSLMKRMGLEPEHWLTVLGEEWNKIVGETVAKHTKPGQVKGSKLTVFVDSSVWLNELSRYGKDKMLSNLQARFGSDRIKSIHIQLDPDNEV